MLVKLTRILPKWKLHPTISFSKQNSTQFLIPRTICSYDLPIRSFSTTMVSSILADMDNDEKLAFLNHISLPPAEADKKKIAACIKEDFHITNVATIRKRLYLYSQIWKPMDSKILQMLYSALFKQRNFKLLLSFHQYLTERDGYVDISITMAEYLMVSAVLDHQSSFAGTIWESLPTSWKDTPSIYCSFVMMLFSKRLFDDGMQLLESKAYKLDHYHDSSLNWKLLKGYELSGNAKACIEFSNELVNNARSNTPILHPLSIDALINSSCKLKSMNQIIKYYEIAKQNGMHLEISSYDRIIKFLVNNEDWKKIYDIMQTKYSDKKQDENLFLLWKAHDSFYQQASKLFFEKYSRKDGQFYYPEELDHRKCDMAQLQVLLTILLDNPPTNFTDLCKTQEYLVINNTLWSKQISSFLTETIYPPIQHSAFKKSVSIPVEKIIERIKIVNRLNNNVESAILDKKDVCDILGYNLFF